MEKVGKMLIQGSITTTRKSQVGHSSKKKASYLKANLSHIGQENAVGERHDTLFLPIGK
jgi:hypothetical protein